MEVVKVDNRNSVLIQDGNIQAWIDVEVKNDNVVCEWNKYIFNLNEPNDLKIKAWQECIDNFDIATSLAIERLENDGIIQQLPNGVWINKPQHGSNGYVDVCL